MIRPAATSAGETQGPLLVVVNWFEEGASGGELIRLAAHGSRCRLLISDVLEIQKQILLARISRTKRTDPDEDADPFKGVGPALFKDA